MVRQTARIIFVEALGAVILLVIVIASALAIRLASGPVSLGFAKDRIETAIAEARDGRPVALGEVTLEWLSDERRAVIVATGLDVFDDADHIVANAERVEILVDVRALFKGSIEPLGLILEKGWLQVQASDAGWKIAGDPINLGELAVNTSEEGQQTDWFGQAESALQGVLATLRRDAAGQSLRTIRFSGFDLMVIDGARIEMAKFEGAYGDLQRSEGGIEIDLGVTSPGTNGGPGKLTIGLSAPADYSEIKADLGLLDWSLEALLNGVPDYQNVVKGLPSDASLSFRVSEADGIEAIEFGLDSGAGELLSLGVPVSISRLAVSGDYSLENDKAELDVLELQSSWVSGPMTLILADALNGDGPRGFTLSAPALNLNLTRYFEDTWPLDNVSAAGVLDAASQTISLAQFGFSFEEARISAQAKLAATRDRKAGELPVEGTVTAELTGPLDAMEILRFWPERQAMGARNYVSRNVRAGTVTQANLQLDVQRGSTAEGYLEDGALQVTFEGEGVSVKPLSDIPLVEGAQVSGAMTGNSVKIDFANGKLSQWDLSEGSVHYPQLVPAGEDMILNVRGSGPAQDLVRMISDSRLKLQERSGFDPGTVSGGTEITLELRRPALPDTPLSAIEYQGTGTWIEGGLENVFSGLPLTESEATIRFDQTEVQIVGDGNLQSSPISYDWQFPFGNEAPPATISASTVVTPDLLNHLGVTGRAYITGSVPVNVDGTLRGTALQTAELDFDFQEARLDVAELDWVKQAGNAATATVNYEASKQEETSARVTFNAADAAFTGAVSLAQDGKLIGADIDNARVAGRFDVSGTALRTSADGLRFDVSGDLLDLSQLVPNFAELGQAGASGEGLGSISLVADIKKLVLGRELDLSDATFSLVAEDGLQTLDVQGKLENGSALTAAYDASGLGDPAFLLTSGDAGFLPSLLFGAEFLQGGELELTGTVGQDGLPTQVHVTISDGRLIEAPVITQILSIASLRGLSDTLNGDGILFTSIEVPLSIKDGRYDIVGARASGPALGLTAKGWINPTSGGIDVEGVMVPSFGVNSALGGLPLIGDLFVSREGEGVFSLRYGVEGSLERAQVSVNPLSAITPGVLRRIFESPETAELPPIEEAELTQDE